MERQKRYKVSVWEFCYANKIFGTFGFEIRACGQKLVKFCAHTHAAKLVVRFSLLCGPISPVVNLEMSSTARFFVEMQYMGAQDWETAGC